jgi:hypothetical protein
LTQGNGLAGDVVFDDSSYDMPAGRITVWQKAKAGGVLNVQVQGKNAFSDACQVAGEEDAEARFAVSSFDGADCDCFHETSNIKL